MVLVLLANLPKVSPGVRDFLVAGISFFFVGLRFEMAYDWPYYKEMFDYLSQYPFPQFLRNFVAIQLQYPAELGFLFLTYVFSQVVPDYEWFQSALYFAFLCSFWTLGRAVGCKNISAALIIVHLFLLFTLEFSTIRQAFAVSLFNFGLAAYLRGRGAMAFLLVSLSLFFQFSALLYIGALLLAATSTKRMWLSAVMVLFLAFPLVFPGVILSLIPIFPSRIADKLVFYFTERDLDLNILEAIFAVTFYVLIVVMSFRVSYVWRRSFDPRLYFLLRFLLVMSIVALVFIPEHVIRNRIFYEVVIVFSLLAFSPYRIARSRYVWPVIAMGTVFMLVSFTRPSTFMYVPYQNYVVNSVLGLSGDGEDRNRRYRQLLEESR
nr:EpsG family protein [Thioalkalivibrio sp. XN8]